MLIDAAASTGSVELRSSNTAVLGLNVNAGGPVRLLADAVIVNGGTFRSTAPGDALVVAGSTTPNASAFSNTSSQTQFVTPNGRWLIYGQSPETLTAGGLPYDFRQYNARAGEPNAVTPSSGNGLLYAQAPVITASAAACRRLTTAAPRPIR